jgi:hypothetical protein
MITGTTLMTLSLVWLSTVGPHASYATKILPGMIVLAIAMGNLFVPLTVTAVSKVEHTDAGLASALLNVGQQVGGALGLSVMTTVFGTSARNYVHGHSTSLFGAIGKLPGDLPKLVGARIAQAGQNGLQKPDIDKFVSTLPHDQQAPARTFFSTTYQDFSHHVLAHASGMGFFAGAVFGLVAIVSAVVLINVKKDEVPTDAEAALVAA